MGQISYAYIDGKCQGWLPRGEVIVDVARGEVEEERLGRRGHVGHARSPSLRPGPVGPIRPDGADPAVGERLWKP